MRRNSRDFSRRRPQIFYSADFQLAAFFSGGFSASDVFSANSADIRRLGGLSIANTFLWYC